MISIGNVVDNTDYADGGRIKVRVNPADHGISDYNLDWSFPLLPKMVHVRPKVGEAVLVFTSESENQNSQRYYIGPLISQPQFINKDSSFLGGTTLLKYGNNTPKTPLQNIPLARGTFPETEEIALIGRRNTDIVLGENEAKIQCGVRIMDDNNNVAFNNKRPAYIKLVYVPDKNNSESKSSVNIVGQDINLITTEGQTPVAENNETITNAAIDEFIKTAGHRLPYGDILAEYLTLIHHVLINHTHPWAQRKPCESMEINMLTEKIANINDNLLSKHVRVN